MNKSRLLALLFVFSFLSKNAMAGEGMWLPFLLKSLNEKEMKSMGMKMDAEDIYSVNKGSLKDAIGHFNGGCTSEIISDQGLLLTNHHCGFGFIQRYSTMEKNYIKDGFWAMNRDEEIPCQGLFVTMISRMEDVTEQVMKGIKKKTKEADRQSIIDKNINALIASLPKEDYEKVTVKPFFKGNQYIAIVTMTYNDVRMVGAPPESIGAFGKDTDNWVWPRHSGDFSLFRIYADENNLPAEYSENNKPLKPKHFLPVSLDGVEEGDFTLVFGFPGRTNEYLPSSAVKQIKDVLDPARIAIRDAALKIMDGYMRSDDKVKLQYASKFARIANSWKKWQGEILGLNKSKAVEKKQNYEAKFMEQVNKKKKSKKKYGNLLADTERLYGEIEEVALAREYYNEIFFRNVELFRIASSLTRMLDTYDASGEEEFYKRKARLDGALTGFYKDYNVAIDQDVFAALIEKYHKEIPEKYHPKLLTDEMLKTGGDYSILAGRIFKYSILTDHTKLNEFLKTPPELLRQALSVDHGIKMAMDFSKMYKEQISPKYNELNDQIESNNRAYLKAQMEMFPDGRFYPDANSTLRVAYGNVEGYEPKDAVRYFNKTYLKGIVEKHIEGDYEFDAPDKLLELYEAKDFGPYAEDGKLPVNFIGSNHTTGGNSGSPAIDAHGNLIGLNFDRAWEGTMSDINYDRSICRNIMVDVRYVLFIVDKFAGAKHLVDEMKLVHPKK